MKISTALKKALTYLEKGRCTNHWSEDKDGKEIASETPWLSRKAAKLCLKGAVYRAYSIQSTSDEARARPAMDLLTKAANIKRDSENEAIVAWQDRAKDATVFKVVNRAIAMAVKDGI